MPHGMGMMNGSVSHVHQLTRRVWHTSDPFVPQYPLNTSLACGMLLSSQTHSTLLYGLWLYAHSGGVSVLEKQLLALQLPLMGGIMSSALHHMWHSHDFHIFYLFKFLGLHFKSSVMEHYLCIFAFHGRKPPRRTVLWSLSLPITTLSACVQP